MKIHSVTILQIMPAPGALADNDGNLYVGYALIELQISHNASEDKPEIVRDILPFGAEGSLIGLPTTNDSYYQAHGLGDDRPDYAQFIPVHSLEQYG